MPRLKVDTDVNLSEPLSKRKLMNCIGSLAGPYEVTLKPIDPQRSNQQNRYFWRVCCQTLAEWFTEQGQTMTKDQAKFIFCCDHLPETFTNPVTGEVKVAPGSTSKLSIPEFAEFLEKCLADMANLGIEVEPPPIVAEGRARQRPPPAHAQT
jgi:hypothetical protein